MKKPEKKLGKIDNPSLFIVITAALLISLSVIVYGALNKGGGEEKDQLIKTDNFEPGSDREELRDYFDKEFEESSGVNVTDIYIRDDPYA